jgi:hypothetical protein
MSQKDRKKVMDDFKELNAVEGARKLKQPAGQQQVRMSIPQVVQMFSEQIDQIKNTLMRLITQQDKTIADQAKEIEELKKKTK